LFALEALPDSSADALAFLCHWLNSAKPGGLLAGLRDRAGHHLKAAPLYQFAGQALLHRIHAECRCTFSGDSRAVAGLAGLFRPARLERVEHEYASCCASSTSAQPCNWPDWTANSAKPGYPNRGDSLRHVLNQIGAVDNFSGNGNCRHQPFLRSTPPTPA
jgi:hypothetical protein